MKFASRTIKCRNHYQEIHRGSTKRRIKWLARTALFGLAIGHFIFGMSFTVLADRIRVINGSFEGDVVSTTRESINVQTEDGTKRLDVINVVSVLFDEEPTGISQARINLANGGYQTVLERIQEAELLQTARPLLLDDVTFMKAEATSRLAINGLADPREAGRLLVNHQKKYPLSFHYYRTLETLGDLLKSMQRFDRAINQYEMLSKAPWPILQARADLLIGLVQQEQDNHAAAIASFDQVILKLASESDIKSQNLEIDAKLAKAKSMATEDLPSEALELVRSVILSAKSQGPDSTEEQKLYALASGYNSLGKYYLAEGETAQALLAFLRVDFLYDQAKAVHAESLFHLVSLWNRYGEPDHARLARSKLRRLYPETRWANQLK